MPRKKSVDEMEPYSADATENALFPEETAGTEDVPLLTESLAPVSDAPPAFLEQDAMELPATDTRDESGAAWDADVSAPDWNNQGFSGSSLDGDSEAAFPSEDFPPLGAEDGGAAFANPLPEPFPDGGGAREDETPDLAFSESAEIPENGTEIPYGEEFGEHDGAENEPSETAEENAVITRQRARTARRGGDAPRESSGAASDRAAFFGLDFNGLDRSLTPEQRQEWNSIYASYRGRSVMSGKIVGVDRAQVQVRNQRTGIMETRRIYCAVVIPFRVRIVIPEMEMWVQGEERPGFVLRNTPGASVDFVIIRVDRENNLAVASRRAALSSRRYYFSTQPSLNRPGSRIQCGVMAVGPRRCLVTCNGYDIDLTQRELSYSSVPDLREAYHPGDVLDCVVKEYDSRANALSISVKEIEPNPFDGAEFRHPEGSTREAVISGKYGGGVFCTLPDNVTVMCNYAFHYDDSTFQIGDRVLVQIQRYENSKKQVYGKIVAKW